nr:putative replicase [Cressdnaviricota sp.]
MLDDTILWCHLCCRTKKKSCSCARYEGNRDMAVAMYIHLTVNPYDPSLDYVKLCKDLFGENKCLVMLESKNRDHLHIQGLPAVTDKVIKRTLKEFALLHYRKKQDPKTHPVKARAEAADEKGFQYMSKDGPDAVVIYKQVFTDEDIKSLHELSNQHREELQTGLIDFIRQSVSQYIRLYSGTPSPRDLHLACAEAAADFYKENDKMSPPNIRALIRHALTKHFWSPEVRTYIATLNL